MSKLIETVDAFKTRQAKIKELHADYQKKIGAFQEECQAKIDAIKSEFETKKAEFAAELDREKMAYKADMKAAFGVTDGETINVLDMIELINRVAIHD